VLWTVHYVLDDHRQVSNVDIPVVCDLLSYRYSRCIAGALNGNIGVMKSVIADITDHTNLAQAFVLIPPVFSVGASIAYVSLFALAFHCSDLDVQTALWRCFGKTT